MTEPVNKKNFGGVDINWNQVKSAQVRKHKDGKETYFIEFKTGVTAEYPMQRGGRLESVPREFNFFTANSLDDIDYDTETRAYALKGATIKGSEKDDHIVGEYIQECTIDVSGDNNDDHVDIEGDSISEHYEGGKYVGSDEFNGSDGNKIVLGNDDTATNSKYRLKFKDGHLDFNIWSDRYIKTTVEGPGIENRF